MDRLILTNFLYLFKRKSLMAFIALAFFGEFIAIGVLANYLQKTQTTTLMTLWISLIIFCNAILGTMIGLSLFKTSQTIGVDNTAINLGYSRNKIILSKFITFFIYTFVLSIFLSLFAMALNATMLSGGVVFTGFLLGSIITISLSASLAALLGLFFKNIIAVIVPVALTGFLLVVGSLISPKSATYKSTGDFISLTENGKIKTFSKESSVDPSRTAKIIGNPILSLDYIYLVSAPVNKDEDKDVITTEVDPKTLFKIKINNKNYIAVFPVEDKRTLAFANEVIANLGKDSIKWKTEIKKVVLKEFKLLSVAYMNELRTNIFKGIFASAITSNLQNPDYVTQKAEALKLYSSAHFDKALTVLLIQNGYLDVTNLKGIEASSDILFDNDTKTYYEATSRIIPRYVYVFIYTLISLIIMSCYFIFYRRKDFKN